LNEHDMYDPEPDKVQRMFTLAEFGEQFTITRYGKPVAVVVGWDEWQRLQGTLAATTEPLEPTGEGER
jgi:antitoxin (DNA-binding transcriptional repressor) of toxin-antitoxin stability system